MEGGSMKRRQAILLAAIFIFAWFAFGGQAVRAEAPDAASSGADATAVNGPFVLGANGSPEGWKTDAYAQTAGTSAFSAMPDGGPDGGAYVRVENREPNDARWVRTIAVEPNAFYRLSAYVRAEIGNDSSIGANVSVLGVATTPQGALHTNGAWTKLEYVGKTGEAQREIAVALRLGGYGSLAVGTADFADFAIEPLGDTAPAGTEWASFDSQPQERQGTGVASGTAPSNGGPQARLAAMLGGLTVCWLLVGGWYVRRSEWTGDLVRADEGRYVRFAGIALAAGLLLRLALAPLLRGYPIDMTDFTVWADLAYRGGLGSFFDAGHFADYPPGYIYVLYVVGLLRDALGLTGDTPAAWLLIKLPALLADIALSALLARAAWRKRGAAAGATVALLMAVHPMLLVSSALWGQIDSIVTLLVALGIVSLTEGRTTRASAWLALAVLVKPQAVVFLPFLAYSLWRRRQWKPWLYAAAWVVGLLVAVVLPFDALRSPSGLWEHYRAMFESYPYASLNAANLFGLLGLNAAPDGRWIGPLTAGAWGNAFTVGALVYGGVLLKRFRQAGREQEGIAFAALLVGLLVFTLRSGMHERYGYTAAVLAVLACAYFPTRRMRAFAAGLALVEFANIGYVLRIGIREVFYLNAHDGFFRFLSLAEVALAGWLAYEGWRMSRANPADNPKQQASKPANRGKSRKPVPAKAPTATDDARTERKLTRRDLYVLGPLTIVYTVVGLLGLGGRTEPDTVWKPAATETTVTRFAEPVRVAETMAYAGLGNGSLTIEATVDGTDWTPAATIVATDGTVFQWQRAPAVFEASAVRIVASGSPAFYEIEFRDSEGRRIEPSTTGAASLFDEPGAVPDRPSYRNSMYFDEIYHARTAYETLHGIEPYETTHPPLGKLIISAGISLFGMNPFGWRVMGALFGIAMVPLLYVLAKRLFGRTGYATLAALLLAFDFLHYTQSRIATVDVFAVFFILLAYFGLYEYYRLSALEGASFRRALIPLALTALGIGLASAVKWIGLYAGAGVAVLLVLVWRAPGFKRDRLPGTLAWTAALFVLLPVAVYLASYIPWMRLPGDGHGFAGVLQAQKNMFAYHSGLVATHPFSSSWWEWPLIRKPVWYYAGQTDREGTVSSIAAMGNPAVWWTGAAAAVWLVLRLRKERSFPHAFVLVGLAAQFVPWMFVTRLTFIYHFYASVPFLILSAVWAAGALAGSRRVTRRWAYGYAAAAGILFAMFYPILSGVPVDRSYVMHALKWFPGWIFSL